MGPEENSQILSMTSAIRKIDANTVEVTVELGSADLAGFVHQAEESIARSINIEGFRKGKVPLEEVRKSISEIHLREEALQIAVRESLEEAVKKEDLDVLDQSNFSIQDNTPDKFKYKLTLTLYPKISLGNYNGIKVKKESVEVTDDELKKVIDDIAISRRANDVTPEINDEFVKSLGHFKSLDDFKISIKTGLAQEKKLRERDRIRGELLKTIIADSNIDVPKLMIERQLDGMIAGFDEDLHSRGMELGPYLAHIKKTQDEFRNDWRSKAEDQVKMSLVLHAIARAEKVTIDDKELQDAFELRIQQYLSGRPDTGTAEALKDLDLERIKRGLFGSIMNEKIFAFIESSVILIS